MPIRKTDIYVYAHWAGMNDPMLIGVLAAHQAKGRKTFSFEYDQQWLQGKNVFLLDPDIKMFSGMQYPSNKENFGVFLDSMPDTWGRTLMKRRAAQLAKVEGKSAPVLYDIDFLLGVGDTSRMGALRFKLDRDGSFVDDDRNSPVPPWTSVAKLQHIAGLVESDKELKELNKWLSLLMAPGSSLGGARPKANISDNKGDLWIAKFPSGKDTIDKAKWEYLAYKLAVDSGINMSVSRIQKVTGSHHTFFTKRFDRRNKERVHFASAMTMTGHDEESIRDSRASYLDIALFLQIHSGQSHEDLAELWRRIVFNIAISNTDDHLRNHGFIISDNAWRLSPAFDINPSIDKDELALNIDENSGELDFELALRVAEYFRLQRKEAESILSQVLKAVGHWETTAKKIGIERAEIEWMRSAFRHTK